MATRTKASSIDEYIADFPEATRKALEQVRAAIRKAAPAATETISYKIPAYRLNNTYLIYFAGYKNHIGIYPAPVEDENFKKAFSKYKTGRGSVQFPLSEPMPIALITKIVKFRIRKTEEKNSARVKT